MFLFRIYVVNVLMRLIEPYNFNIQTLFDVFVLSWRLMEDGRLCYANIWLGVICCACRINMVLLLELANIGQPHSYFYYIRHIYRLFLVTSQPFPTSSVSTMFTNYGGDSASPFVRSATFTFRFETCKYSPV